MDGPQQAKGRLMAAGERQIVIPFEDLCADCQAGIDQAEIAGTRFDLCGMCTTLVKNEGTPAHVWRDFLRVPPS